MQTFSARHFRPLSVAVLALIVGILTGVPALASPAATSTQAIATLANTGYDLVTASGIVRSFGGATNWGSNTNSHLRGAIVGMAVVPNGSGYWLVGSDGGVFSFGKARFYGSLGATKVVPGEATIGIVTTATGNGYWLVNEQGKVTSFGGAAALPSLPLADQKIPIVSVSISRDGTGIWYTNAHGNVWNLGSAGFYGSLARTTIDHPITAITATPDGKGYWLAESDGDVHAFGDAVKAPPPPSRMLGSVVGIVPAVDNLGFWATTNEGWVLLGGDAFSKGGTNSYVDGSPIVAIAAAPGTAPIGAGPGLGYPKGSIGYDVNWPQCAASGSSSAGTLPGPPSYPAGTRKYTVAVVGVDGWAVDADNSCLAAEVAWAKKAAYANGTTGVPPYELYLFLNSPARTSVIDQSGPAGTCSSYTGTRWAACLSYNYGYNAAALAFAYAGSKGARAHLWWLDVENQNCAPGIYNRGGNGEFWSCDQALNTRTIQGAIDELRHAGVVAGVYSTASQWRSITGGYVPKGAQVPLWIAGAYWTSPPYPTSYHYSGPSINAPYCATTSNPHAFAGGKPLILQETPGPNNYPFDPNYAC